MRESEMKYWEQVTPGCMTEESDSENGEKIITHQLLWRSECMSIRIMKGLAKAWLSEKRRNGFRQIILERNVVLRLIIFPCSSGSMKFYNSINYQKNPPRPPTTPHDHLP